MFRIRRIHDDAVPEDARAIEQVQQILRAQFPGVDRAKVEAIPSALRDPTARGFRTILFVAERSRGLVKGFALLLHAPDLDFCYLDFMASGTTRTGGGIGGALYQRARDEALALGAVGVFFEALPDDPALCRDPATVRQNAARLRFYERYGARPIAGTEYETPVRSGGDCPPYLAFDDLGRARPLRRTEARRIIRAILERLYGDLCPAEYIDRIVGSFRDDPVRLREPRYAAAAEAAARAGAADEAVAAEAGARNAGPRKSAAARAVGRAPQRMPAGAEIAPGRRIGLVVNDKHEIHHVRERGYVEAPVRVRAILRELAKLDVFDAREPKRAPDGAITAVHDPDFVRYLERVCASLEPDAAVYPYVFPIRNVARPPADLAVRAGYYCIDTFTPLGRNAWSAARRAVDCALTAAQMILEGAGLAYALVRPPGHHAERRAFGGFCYLCNAAIAAHQFAAAGRVAILDVDYHHGNGQQDIFWRRGDVLTISIHGHPRFAYPYFSGFEDERGEGDGEGCNVNIPLGEKLDGKGYQAALRRAVRAIETFRPEFLVVALGLDSAKGDPTGTWSLGAADFEANGRMIGGLGIPTLIVQEGGYRSASLGVNARRFFEGLWSGKYLR